MKTYFKRDDEGIFRQNERPVKLNIHKKLSMKVKKGEKYVTKRSTFPEIESCRPKILLSSRVCARSMHCREKR